MKSSLVSTTVLIISLFPFLKEANPERILAVEFLGSKSHVLTYLPLLEELSRRGHEVTLLSPLMGFTQTGIREIPTVDMGLLTKDLNLNMYEMKEANVDADVFALLTEIAPKHCAALYDRADIQAIMEESFDLVILQPMFNDCALGLVHKVMQQKKAPLILFTPTSAPSFIVGFTGGHHPPSFVPGVLTGFRDEMTFLERAKNFAAEALMYCVFSYYYLPQMESIYRSKLGNNVPAAREILSTTSIILSNGHFSLSRPKPNLPNVVDIGGIHSRPANPLPKDLQDFIEKSGEDGFILFSFGSGLRGDEMPARKRQIFINVFAQLKQRVLWKYESDFGAELPSNVMVGKWLPQQDLLGHPKIKMFITHCGLGGMEESIFNGVPLLGMPFFGDQPLNAKEAENHGFLLKLDWNDMTEETLLNSINTILRDPSYKRSAQKLSVVFKDQIDSPLGRAVWWTEYVLRHHGAPKLQSPARKLNFVEYHCIDVMATYLFLFALAVYVVWKIIIFIFSFLFSFGAANGQKKKQS